MRRASPTIPWLSPRRDPIRMEDLLKRIDDLQEMLREDIRQLGEGLKEPNNNRRGGANLSMCSDGSPGGKSRPTCGSKNGSPRSTSESLVDVLEATGAGQSGAGSTEERRYSRSPEERRGSLSGTEGSRRRRRNSSVRKQWRRYEFRRYQSSYSSLADEGCGSPSSHEATQAARRDSPPPSIYVFDTEGGSLTDEATVPLMGPANRPPGRMERSISNRSMGKDDRQDLPAGTTRSDWSQDKEARSASDTMSGTHGPSWMTDRNLDFQEHEERFHAACKRLVESTLFENIAGICVVLNAIALGWEVDHTARRPMLETKIPASFIALDLTFVLIFSFELGLRIYVHGARLFTMPGWSWNVFDMLMVSFQILHLCVQHFLTNLRHPGQHVELARSLQLARLLRVARIFRTFQLFSELRIMVASMSAALGSLVWSIVLQMVMVYVFALVFLQVVTNYRLAHEADDELCYWFDSLHRAMFTMIECILGGVSWDAIVGPLNEQISPYMGALFVAYVAASVFAMMNLVTGLFVTEVLNKVKEDKDEAFVTQLSELFSQVGAHTITKEEFLEHITHKPPMMEYLKSLDINPADSLRLFEILDYDNEGFLDRNEMLEAFLRLRGTARQVDIQVLRRELADIAQSVGCMASPQANSQQLAPVKLSADDASSVCGS